METVDIDLMLVVYAAFGTIALLAATVVPIVVIVRSRKSRANGGGRAVDVRELSEAPAVSAIPAVQRSVTERDEADDGHTVLRPSEYARYRKGRVVLFVLSAVLLAFGFYMLVMNSPVHAAISTWHYHQWPKTTATIVAYDGTHHNRGNHTWRVYHYELDGQQREGYGPFLAGFKNGPLDMPVGMKVTIAYNPDDPEEVLSEADSQVDLYRFDGLVLGVPTLLFGAFLAFAAFQKVRVQKTPQRRRGRSERI